MASKRKFYRTVYEVEVLSEEPIPSDVDIAGVIHEATHGDYSMHVRGEKVEEVDARTMATLLQEQASDPEFFRLDAEGNDVLGLLEAPEDEA